MTGTSGAGVWRTAWTGVEPARGGDFQRAAILVPTWPTGCGGDGSGTRDHDPREDDLVYVVGARVIASRAVLLLLRSQGVVVRVLRGSDSCGPILCRCFASQRLFLGLLCGRVAAVPTSDGSGATEAYGVRADVGLFL